MFKQLVVALLIGTIIVMHNMQYDAWFKLYMLEQFKHQFEQSCKCCLHANIEDVSLSGTMTLNNVRVSPLIHNDWSWSAKKFTLSFSWLELLLYGTLDMTIDMDQLAVYSNILETGPAIQKHCDIIFNGPQEGIYTFLKEITCHNVTYHLSNKTVTQQLHLAFNAHAIKQNDLLKIALELSSGMLHTHERTLFSDISGPLQLEVQTGKQLLHFSTTGAPTLVIPQLNEEAIVCNISGHWSGTNGICHLKSIDNKFAINPIIVNQKSNITDISIEAKAPITYIGRIINNNNEHYDLSGNCFINAKISLTPEDYNLHGNITLQRIFLKETEIGSLAKLSFNKNENHLVGSIYLQRTSGASFDGTWQIGLENGEGTADIKNNVRLTLPPKHNWQILPDDLLVDLQFNKTTTKLHYNTKATHAKIMNDICSQGDLTVNNNTIIANGIFDNNNFTFQLQYQPKWIVDHFLYTRPDATNLIDIQHIKPNAYKAIISVLCIKDVLKKKYDYELQGEGDIEVDIITSPKIYAQIHLRDGTIRLPHTYNFLNAFDCNVTIDTATKQCDMENLSLQLHNGKIHSKKISASYTDQFALKTVYAPVLLENCFINMGHELFAVISGNLLLQKSTPAHQLLTGQIIIDRSQLKENIFSDIFQRKLRNYTARSFAPNNNDLSCDINIKTKHPVKIQTSFLQTDARINLQMKESINDPQVTGAITIHTGKLFFPYKPLYITSGTLHFIAGKIDDPIIELSAKNNIKKHDITLQVTGSMQQQHIQLESSPTLTEEQIVSLLLIGSQEESLNIVMPALIMQNFKSMILGNDQSTAHMSRYFNALLKPFGRIHLVPSFIDRSGRGGLRGAIEFELSEHFRAIIQKNFTLTEDTRLEFEYLFSDEMSARLTRDIRRDWIAEIEMRHKFGNN